LGGRRGKQEGERRREKKRRPKERSDGRKKRRMQEVCGIGRFRGGVGIYCKKGEQEEGKREKRGWKAKMKVMEKKGEEGKEKEETNN
jgi:hypothetical protein